jgi:hypothetical protein
MKNIPAAWFRITQRTPTRGNNPRDIRSPQGLRIPTWYRPALRVTRRPTQVLLPTPMPSPALRLLNGKLPQRQKAHSLSAWDPQTSKGPKKGHREVHNKRKTLRSALPSWEGPIPPMTTLRQVQKPSSPARDPCCHHCRRTRFKRNQARGHTIVPNWSEIS